MRAQWAFALALLGCNGAFGTSKAEISLPKSVDAASVPLVPSHVSIHRLTNDEYTNTVQDLLFTQSRPGDAFPLPSVGQSGFKNDSQALSVTPDWVARVYAAADTLAAEVIASKGTAGGAYARLVACGTGAACAESVLTALA